MVCEYASCSHKYFELFLNQNWAVLAYLVTTSSEEERLKSFFKAAVGVVLIVCLKTRQGSPWTRPSLLTMGGCLQPNQG